jgi:hypothetical protein
MMPGFFKQMPQDKPGDWMACVVKISPFRGEREVASVKVKGFRKAYIFARLMAFWWDLKTDDYEGMIGINWAIRKPTP